ncbi:MAG: hypothetical protein RLZZ232_2664 [Planctomycetota bacterium]
MGWQLIRSFPPQFLRCGETGRNAAERNRDAGGEEVLYDQLTMLMMF